MCRDVRDGVCVYIYIYIYIHIHIHVRHICTCTHACRASGCRISDSAGLLEEVAAAVV